MEYIKLNNGVEMPALGFGTYKIEDEKECIASIRAALDAGYRLFDTARFYQNESFIGKALAESGIEREKLFLTTKLWPSEFEEPEAAVEDSLKQLGTSYLDLVLLHWPYGNIYKAWRALEKLNDSGVIRAIGVSNFNSDRLIDLIAYNRIVPAVNQVEANVWCQRRPEAPWHGKYGVVMQAYAPMGRCRPPEFFEDPVLNAVAAAHGKSVRQVMLRYLMQIGIAVIPKSVHPERIAENFQILDFSLNDAEMASIAELDLNEPVIGKPQDPERTSKLTSL